MKTRSKALLLTLCAVLLVAASVLGTMAYLTSTGEVKNTFTVGQVKITLDEAKVDVNGKALKGDAAERVTNNSYKLLPGHSYDKDPTIHVDPSSEDCFIRAKVTINHANEWQALVTKYAGGNLTNIITGFDENIWWVDSKCTTIDTVNNTITYTFVYKNENHTEELSKRIWTKSDSTDLVLFKEIKMPGGLTNEEIAEVANTEITVIAEAIQADGFTSEADAWAAFAGRQ